MHNENEIFDKVLKANEKLEEISYLKKKIVKVKNLWGGWDSEKEKEKELIIYYNPEIKQIKENSWYGGWSTRKENILIKDYLNFEEIKKALSENWSWTCKIDREGLLRPSYLPYNILVQEPYGNKRSWTIEMWNSVVEVSMSKWYT